MARRVTLVAWGSRGDVAPILSLGMGLQASGDIVTVLTSRDFADLVELAGLVWAPFDISVQDAASSPAGRTWLGGHRTLLGEGRALRKVLDGFAQPLIEGLWEHTRDADLVISGILTADACASLTAARDQQHAVALLTPVMPSRHGPSSPTAVLPSRDSGVNALSGRAVLAASYRLLRVPGDELRQRLGHRRTRGGWLLARLREMPVVVGTSRYVVPPAPDQPNVTITGYWPPFGAHLNPDEGTRIEAAITEAHADSRCVAYLGFGSMTTRDPAGTARLLIDAAHDAGVHPIVSNGWAGMNAQLDGRGDVTLVDEVPHDWLFPRLDAVVHHGGAGTTGSTVRSGSPQVVVAHMGDQPFWATRAHRLGISAEPLRRSTVSRRQLTAALRRVTTNSTAGEVRRRARELAQRVAKEDGVATAVAALHASTRASPK